jgi:hypothetical protein
MVRERISVGIPFSENRILPLARDVVNGKYQNVLALSYLRYFGSGFCPANEAKGWHLSTPRKDWLDNGEIKCLDFHSFVPESFRYALEMTGVCASHLKTWRLQ